MKPTLATLMIDGRTFTIGEAIQTPRGAGVVIGLDPFADTEIGVRLADGAIAWFAFREFNPQRFICDACGQIRG